MSKTMKTTPTLYKRTSTGKIQEWRMEVEGNKLRTVCGQQGGKKVIATWTTCKAKNVGKVNESTPEDQAWTEALAKYTLKLKEDYKENIKDVDNIIFKSPMLAEEYTDETKLDFPVYTQPKLDGMRAIINKNGMWSREGNPIFSCPHILEALTPVFDENPDIELDGELYNHTLKENFDELISMTKKGKPTPEALEKSKKHIKYYIYDHRDSTKKFIERSVEVRECVNLCRSKSLVFVAAKIVKNQEILDKYYKQYLEEGYEGEMIRANTPYTFKRTNDLLKRKPWITDEFEVVDILEGKGNRSGMAGKVVLKLKKPTIDGKNTVEANPIGGFEFYRRLLKDKAKVIGKPAETMFQNYTPKGSLRFPKVRTIRNYE